MPLKWNGNSYRTNFLIGIGKRFISFIEKSFSIWSVLVEIMYNVI